jgi:hypothetical protein
MALRRVGCLGRELHGPHLRLAVSAPNGVNILSAQLANDDLGMGSQENLRPDTCGARDLVLIIDRRHQQILEQPRDAVGFEAVLNLID